MARDEMTGRKRPQKERPGQKYCWKRTKQSVKFSAKEKLICPVLGEDDDKKPFFVRSMPEEVILSAVTVNLTT